MDAIGMEQMVNPRPWSRVGGTKTVWCLFCGPTGKEVVMRSLTQVCRAAFIWIVALNSAYADQPGRMPMEQVKQKVLQSGYTQVTKIKADDGRWEGEGIKNGKKMDFHADPKTGQITHEKPDD
jgi:hypothetical protein